MIQKFLVEVDTPKPLNEYGDGHVLLFNAKSGRYYVTTRENLFAVQDAKIKKLEQEIQDFERKESESFKTFKEELVKEIEKFENNALKREENFLSQYQETNSRLIDMVKKVIIEE